MVDGTVLQFTTQLAPMWSTIRGVREKVGELMKSRPADLKDAVQMVASELLENAVKYGESTPGCPNIDFDIGVQDGLITIRVSNGFTQVEHLERLRNRIEEISSAEDKEQPYIRQLERLLETPTANAGLGIYRIGFEGEFDLRFEYNEGKLTVTATRSMR